MALQQKVTTKSFETSEFDRRLILQSLMQSCAHVQSVESLRCFAGHPLIQRPCDAQTRCAHCSACLNIGIQHFSCVNQKPQSSITKRCDWSLCMLCAREQCLAQSVLYSPFDVATCIRALERFISQDKLQEGMKSFYLCCRKCRTFCCSDCFFQMEITSNSPTSCRIRGHLWTSLQNSTQ